ncbi:hypothetical protein [Phenylobacterium sp.]|uniref:hypothetical protein n=1 Tax=Phenylobacterium sp. TaxID=1871053 RepID=UPI0035680385
MNDREFEALLATAYRAPSGRPERPELAVQVLAQVQRRRAARRGVLALATLVGVGVAGLTIAATGVMGMLAGVLAKIGPEPAFIDPNICLSVGFFLTLLAAARNEIREL